MLKRVNKEQISTTCIGMSSGWAFGSGDIIGGLILLAATVVLLTIPLAR
jgi:hypothetical protein